MSFATLEVLRKLESRMGLELPDIHILTDKVKVTSLKARQSAFGVNEICPRVFVVRSGLLKQLYVKEDGTEWIKSFTRAGRMFACPFALSPNGRTTFASVAIEPSVVESFDFDVIHQLGDNNLAWQKVIRVCYQLLGEMRAQRDRDLLTLTPQELYQKFVTESPEIASRISQKDLAAFLGVTPVGLNRIVKRDRGQA